MYDTNITVLGNVATQPQQRQFASGALTDFRLASTSRRYDKRQSKWVDGDELFIKVSCWRGLGDNVHSSISVGDPVIVRGRLYSRRQTQDDGSSRYYYEVNAQAVGHDLSRGTSYFTRQAAKTTPSGSYEGDLDAYIVGSGHKADDKELTMSALAA